MVIVLDRNSTHEERQQKLMDLQKNREAKRYKAKKKMIEETFGKVVFDKEKTAKEIYKEMRDEWN